MIPEISDTNELNKIIRAKIIEQTGLDGKWVRNALSPMGSMLDKNEDDEIYTSIDPTDVLILFELGYRDNNSDFTEDDGEDNISYYKSYDFNITIYGDEASNTGYSLISKFRTDYVRQTLWDQGVYLESVSSPTSVNEFVNKRIWKRCDFTINIACRMVIKKTTDYYKFNSVKIDKIKIV